jgi:multimeric flavodoxin WrbA
MQEVFAALSGAGAVVLASPIYFGSVSAQVKAMIDRFQCVWLAEHRRGIRLLPGERVCAFIACSAGDRRDFFENARQVVRNWAATAHARLCEELYCPGVEEKGSVAGRPGVLRAARALGKRLAAEAQAILPRIAADPRGWNPAAPDPRL